MYSQELEAYLGAGFLIADRVRSVIRRQFAQLDHNVPKFGAGTDISFRTNTYDNKNANAMNNGKIGSSRTNPDNGRITLHPAIQK